jgi:hypothetical protein
MDHVLFCSDQFQENWAVHGKSFDYPARHNASTVAHSPRSGARPSRICHFGCICFIDCYYSTWIKPSELVKRRASDTKISGAILPVNYYMQNLFLAKYF